ncbi:hypothetical protein FRB91_008067 [Serendipita sp. 411]|nr:hypothetical protein FRB91_008067 [Serendipita sp. 411]
MFPHLSVPSLSSQMPTFFDSQNTYQNEFSGQPYGEHMSQNYSDEDENMSSGGSSPTTVDVDGDITPIDTNGLSPRRNAEELAPHNAALQQLIEYILSTQDPTRYDMNNNEVDVFNTGSEVGNWTCSLMKNGKPCPEKRQRRSRFKDHINRHLGIMLYTCRSDRCNCGTRFFAHADKDTHERNTEKIACSECDRLISPRNLARHRATQKCRKGTAARIQATN